MGFHVAPYWWNIWHVRGLSQHFGSPQNKSNHRVLKFQMTHHGQPPPPPSLRNLSLDETWDCYPWMFRTHHSAWNSSTKHKNLRWKNIWKIQPLLLNHLFSINNQIFAPILGTFPLIQFASCQKLSCWTSLDRWFGWPRPWWQKTNSTQEIFNQKNTPRKMFFFPCKKRCFNTKL